MASRTPQRIENVKKITLIDFANMNDSKKEYAIASYVLNNDHVNGTFISRKDFAKMLGYDRMKFNAIYRKAKLKLTSEVSTGMVSDAFFDWIKDERVKLDICQDETEIEINMAMQQIFSIMKDPDELRKHSSAITALADVWKSLRLKKLDSAKVVAELMRSWGDLQGHRDMIGKVAMKSNADGTIEACMTLEEYVNRNAADEMKEADE